LNGYADMQLISPKGDNLPTSVQQGGSGIPSSLSQQAAVNLAPSGGQASFMAYWVAVPSSSQPNCPVASSANITVPGSKVPVKVTKAEFNACGGVIQVSPFQPNVISLP
jgi:Protein of unknown function (DUF4232)